MKKKISIALLVLVLIVCSLSLVGCNKKKAQAEEALNNYVFAQSGNLVSEDFTLPSKISDLDATWTSDKTDYISLEQREEDWLAKVTLPETGEETITLTLTIYKVSKDFYVRVKAIDIYDIADNYVFTKEQAVVVNDFALESTATYKGKTAQISWSVAEAYNEIIAVSEDGKTCVVTQQTMPTQVKIKATFTYNGQTSTKNYRMTVYIEMDEDQLVDYWYSNTGVSITLSGYVTAVGEAYSSYGNVTFYMVNDNFTAGYYIYRIKTDEATGNKVVPGAHVTVTNSTNTNYNGLIETNSGTGNLTVDEDIAAIDLSTTVKAIDELVLGDLPATIYNESRLVSLTNWTVASIAETVKEGDNFTLMTLTKGGVKVGLKVSKYVKGVYEPVAGNAVYDALIKLPEKFAVGSTVNVKGMLSSKYNNNWEIILLSADDVTAGGTADAEGTAYAGQKVGKVVENVNKVVPTTKVIENTTITLPASTADVTVTYSVVTTSQNVTLNGTTLTINPVKEEKTTLRIDYKCGEFATVQFVYITSSTEADPEPEPKPEQPEPDVETITVAKAQEIIAGLTGVANATTYYTNENGVVTVYVKGYVTVAGTAGSYQQKFYIADSKDATQADSLYVYSANYGENVEALQVGDLVIVKGFLAIYNEKTAEMTSYKDADGKYTNQEIIWQKAATTEPEQPEEPEVKSITVAEAQAIIAGLTGVANQTVYYTDANGVVTVYVKGYVTVAGTAGTYQQKFYIADSKDATQAESLYVYSANYGTDVTALNVGEMVIVKGFLAIYNEKTAEMTSYKDADGKYTNQEIIWQKAATTEPEQPENPGTTKVVEAAEAPFVAGKEYVLTLTYNGAQYYAINDAASTYYVATVQAIADIQNVFVEVVEGGYNLYFEKEGTKTYLNATVSGTHVNLTRDASATTTWAYNAENKAFYASVVVSEATKEYYIGAKGTYTSLGMYTIDVLNPAYLGEVKEQKTPETPEIPDTHEEVDANGDFLCDECSKFMEKEVSDEADIVNMAYVLPVGEALSKPYTLTGVITKVDSAYDTKYKNVTVTIQVGEMTEKLIQCYRLAGENANIIAAGDTITVTGTIKNYNGKIEFDAGCTLDLIVSRGNGTISVATDSSENATVAFVGATTAPNGTVVTFTVEVKEGFQLTEVKVNGTTVTANEGVYSATIVGATTVKVFTAEEGAATLVKAAEITFNKGAGLDKIDADTQVWTANGITVTNNKSNSQTVVNNYDPTTTTHMRAYKDSEMVISYTGMAKIVINCTAAKYAFDVTFGTGVTGFKSSTDGSTVTITMDSASDTCTFYMTNGQLRITSIEVYTIA